MDLARFLYPQINYHFSIVIHVIISVLDISIYEVVILVYMWYKLESTASLSYNIGILASFRWTIL